MEKGEGGLSPVFAKTLTPNTSSRGAIRKKRARPSQPLLLAASAMAASSSSSSLAAPSQWVDERAKAEATRLEGLGQKALVLSVTGMSVAVPEGAVVAALMQGGAAAGAAAGARTTGGGSQEGEDEAAASAGSGADAAAGAGAGAAAAGAGATSPSSGDKKGGKKKAAASSSSFSSSGGSGKKQAAVQPTNRVVFDTSFDFDKVKQILVSPAVNCEPLPGYRCANVVLLTHSSPVALLFPYVWNPTAASAFGVQGNDLARWCFVNRAGKESTHVVKDGFADVR